MPAVRRSRATAERTLKRSARLQAPLLLGNLRFDDVRRTVMAISDSNLGLYRTDHFAGSVLAVELSIH